MESLLSRSVKIHISNNTKNITLKNPRIYFGLGYCSKDPRSKLSPGSRDTCSFTGDPQPWGLGGTTGVSRILVYEAESFTLAIYFYNPSHHDRLPMRLGLELSPGKAHLDDLEATYKRMAKGTYSSSDQDIKSARVVIVAGSHETAQVSHGPIKVKATMVSQTSSRIWVVLEEEKGSEEEAERQKPQDVKGDRSKRSEKKTDPRETLQDLLQGTEESPGTAQTA